MTVLEHLFVRRIAPVVVLALYGLMRLEAAEALIPHPAIERTGITVAKQLGDFGESVVDAGFRARGFKVIDGNLGVHGIDRIAAKYSVTGQLTEVCLIEVKTRQTTPEFMLATTADGPQLSDGWIVPRLERLAREHSDAEGRAVARDVLNSMKNGPRCVRRELHGIAVAPDKYLVMPVDQAGRITGVSAEGRLSSLLKTLASRGATEETRKTAHFHLSQFDQMQAETAAESPGRAAFSKIGTERTTALLRKSESSWVGGTAARETSMVVADKAAAQTWFGRVARQPGVCAAGATFAVDQAFTSWEYHQGRTSLADFQRHSFHNGVRAAAVGMATQVVYLVAASPGGLVLIGIAVIAYTVTDLAIKAYDDTLLPRTASVNELAGIIAESCLATPMLDDVAAGRTRRSER